MDRHQGKFRSQTGSRLDHHSFQAPGLEGAGRVHAPLQHQMGGLSPEPEVAARNRERGALAERDQARQLRIAPASIKGEARKLTLFSNPNRLKLNSGAKPMSLK